MEIGLTSFLKDLTSVKKSANQPLIRNIRFTQVEPFGVRQNTLLWWQWMVSVPCLVLSLWLRLAKLPALLTGKPLPLSQVLTLEKTIPENTSRKVYGPRRKALQACVRPCSRSWTVSLSILCWWPCLCLYGQEMGTGQALLRLHDCRYKQVSPHLLRAGIFPLCLKWNKTNLLIPSAIDQHLVVVWFLYLSFNLYNIFKVHIFLLDFLFADFFILPLLYI